ATLQKGQAVTLNQLVSTLVDPVELKIARGPVQVGAGHVDTSRRAGAAEGSMHRSRGGVAKQIEEAGVTGVCLKPQPDRAMVEEQPGVQVALQVDDEAGVALADHDVISTASKWPILLLAALALAHLEHDVAGIDADFLHDMAQPIPGLAAAQCRLLLTHRGRGLVLLHMNAIAIAVDGEGILRHIRIVESIALDSPLPRPAPDVLQILAQAVGEHECAIVQLHRCLGSIVALLMLLVDGAVADIEKQQLCRQGAVEQGIALVTVDAQQLAPFRSGSNDGGTGAQGMIAQEGSQLLIEDFHFGLLAQALGIGRVADHQSRRSRWYRVADARNNKVEIVDNASALGIAAGELDHPWVNVAASSPALPRCSGLSALACLFQHRFHGSLIVLRPG